MKPLAILLLTIVPTALPAQPIPIRSSDFKPNPAFVPVAVRGLDKPHGNVAQLGEVVIMEGDDHVVSSDGKGGYGLSFGRMVQNPLEITRRLYETYGDDFDEIIVFTTFDDMAARGAMAYEMSTQQDVRGIGQDRFDESREWGSSGALYAFVNMMKWDQYKMFGYPLTDPRSGIYSTLGQEFAHRWLAFLRYKDGTGQVSEALLGRDGAHWASTLQAYGSLLDGVELDSGTDGMYTVKSFMSRFSPLDLYAMGLIDASEVEPFFKLNGATGEDGKSIAADEWLFPGTKIKGLREEIKIEQVVAAEGARTPAAAASPHAFRVAFVLVTRPGERASDVVEAARLLNQVRKVWEGVFSEYTNARGTMCTQVSARCGVATATIIGGQVRDWGGNYNSIAEPGEDVAISFTVENDSAFTANAVKLRATGALIDGTVESEVGTLVPSQRRDVTLRGHLPEDAQCGVAVTVSAQSIVDGNVFRGFAQVVPGWSRTYEETFEASKGGFTVEGDAENGWQYGTPAEYRSARSGWVFQPAGGRSGKKAWFTGLQPGTRPYADSSLGVGTSMLVSSTYPLGRSYKPTLQYHYWLQAFDFSNPEVGGQPVDTATLVVEGSSDGKTWVPLDSVTGFASEWISRDIALDGKLPLVDGTRFRFVVTNDSPTVVFEAGIDDIELFSLGGTCNPNLETPAPVPPARSGGCTMSARAPVGAWLLAALLVGFVWLRRRLARSH